MSEYPIADAVEDALRRGVMETDPWLEGVTGDAFLQAIFSPGRNLKSDGPFTDSAWDEYFDGLGL